MLRNREESEKMKEKKILGKMAVSPSIWNLKIFNHHKYFWEIEVRREFCLSRTKIKGRCTFAAHLPKIGHIRDEPQKMTRAPQKMGLVQQEKSCLIAFQTVSYQKFCSLHKK